MSSLLIYQKYNHFYLISSCPQNWLDLGENGCFYFAKQANTPTWQKAQNFCNNLGDEIGGDVSLAEIHNHKTQEKLAQRGSKINTGFDWWLGAVSSDKGQVHPHNYFNIHNFPSLRFRFCTSVFTKGNL